MIPIPEGSESYSEEPSGSEYSTSQDTLDQPLDEPGPLVNNGGDGFAEPAQVPEMKNIKRIRGACELSGVI